MLAPSSLASYHHHKRDGSEPRIKKEPRLGSDIWDHIQQGRANIMAQGGSYQTAVVLQGGGALGAYEYGVLKALYEARPGFTPAVVTGVSIGAITAAVLVGAPSDPLGALGELWEKYFAVF